MTRKRSVFVFFCGIFLLIPSSLRAGEFVEELRERIKERKEAYSYIPLIKEVLLQGGELPIEPLERSPYLPFTIAEAYQNIGSPEMALFYYERSLEKAGDDEIYLFDLLLLFEERGLNKLYHQTFESILQHVGWGDRNEEISSYFYFKGRDLLRVGNREEGMKFLRMARELNPWDLSNHITLMNNHFIAFDPEIFDDLNWILYAVKMDFKAQHLFIFTVFRSLLVLILFLSAFIVTGLLVRTIPHLHHRIFERLSTLRISTLLRLSLPARKIGGWLILSIPLLLGLPSYLLLLISLPFLWILEKGRKERFLLFMIFLFLMSYPFFMGIDSKLYHPLNPEGDLRYLLSENKDQEDLRNLYLLAERSEDPALYFNIGLEEKVEKSYLAAKEAYLKAYDQSPSADFQSIILDNLGNLYFELGEYENAIDSYQKAIVLKPNSPLPHFNLSQVYSILIRLEEATQELNLALALDPLLSRVGRRVMDEPLPSTLLWRRTIENNPMSFSEFIRSGGGITRFLLPFLVLIFTLVISIFFEQKFLLMSCQLCNRPICSRCSKNEEDQHGSEDPASDLVLCPRCWKTFSTTSPNLQDQFINRKKQESQNSLRKKAWIYTLLVPGFGHFFIRSSLKGFFIGAIASLLWGFFFRIHPIYLTPPNPGIPPYPLIFLILIFYLLSFRSIQKTLRVREKLVLEPVEKQSPRKGRKGFVEARLMEEMTKTEEEV